MMPTLHRFYGGRDLHFLTFSCYRRQPLFTSATHCDLFLQILEGVRRRYRLVVLGYVVMPEQVHLLVSEPQRATLSTAIQALKLGVVRSLERGAVPMSRKNMFSPMTFFTGCPKTSLTLRSSAKRAGEKDALENDGRARATSEVCGGGVSAREDAGGGVPWVRVLASRGGWVAETGSPG